MNPFDDTMELEAPCGRLQFRPVRAGDEEGLLAFFRDGLSPRSQYLFCPHDPLEPERCLVEFGERIRRHAEHRDLTLVVEREGVIAGYFFLWRLDRSDGKPPTLGIGLADALHGQGIGAAMMDCLIDRARALGLPAIKLTHESTNERASRLYQSRCFVYTGEEQHSGPDGARIERAMRLDLAPSAQHAARST
jgi:RimJ/RimL family protein N-acetyltransferase